ncbi:hypothetical protein [Paractinoplanes toevensis]|uniref:Uncharacterized protein n=1 Tax=Paractinoplanes toevensis TaxID=571911 RepID=A0A919W6F4_9ACTN|nr:hypothetical protein [Actinoplanes toevensis]GIM94565.1 hypothetical protein Ato02nite_063580 [Actinoplanes toevensis]
MATVTTTGRRNQRTTDNRAVIVKASLLGCGSFTTGVTSLLVVAGRFGVSDELARFAIIAVCIIAALGQLTAAACLLTRHSPRP